MPRRRRLIHLMTSHDDLFSGAGASGFGGRHTRYLAAVSVPRKFPDHQFCDSMLRALPVDAAAREGNRNRLWRPEATRDVFLLRSDEEQHSLHAAFASAAGSGIRERR